jgi:uncharacterized protein
MIGASMRSRLREHLTAALKARDAVAVAALRSALAAIDNAEAVDAGAAAPRPPSSPHVAGASAGVGSSDVERRALSEADIREIVREQIEERTNAAEQYDRHGRPEQAERLRREAAVLSDYLG